MMAVASQIGGSPRVITSYSTAWIRKLGKSDLEWEVAHLTLSTEGSRNELRRRLNKYVRAHPEQYIRVNWILQLDESTLRAKLEDCALRIPGSKEELALCLFKYIRDHPEKFLEFPLELGDIGHDKEPHIPFPLDIVRKMGFEIYTG
jgi:hypothetical protein